MANINTSRAALNRATQAAAVTNAAALTAAASAAAPTKTEFDKVVADNVVIHTKLNALLGVLRTAGLIAP